LARQPPVGQGLLIHEVSRLHTTARRRDVYLTAHNTHNKYPYPPMGFEPTISVGERSQTHTLDRAAPGIGYDRKYQIEIPAASDFVHRLISKERVQITGLSPAQFSRSHSFPLARGFVHIYIYSHL
jgi:hypothetical protein